MVEWALKSLVHKITNVPVFLYGAGHMDFDAGKSISRALVMDFPHPSEYVPPHINNRYINSYYTCKKVQNE